MPNGLNNESNHSLCVTCGQCSQHVWHSEIREWDDAAFRLLSGNRRHDVLKTGICKQGVTALFFPSHIYMTVNILPVSSILKELYDIQHDSENIIWSNGSNTSQYWSSSLLYAHIMIRMAKDMRWCPEDIRCCYSYRTVHCDTGEAAQELKPTPPLSRTNWSFNHLRPLFVCVRCCAFGSTFWIQVPHDNNILCVCVCLVLHVNIVYLCFFLLFLCRTKFSRCVKKERSVRKWENLQASLLFFFFDWHPTTGNS